LPRKSEARKEPIVLPKSAAKVVAPPVPAPVIAPPAAKPVADEALTEGFTPELGGGTIIARRSLPRRSTLYRRVAGTLVVLAALGGTGLGSWWLYRAKLASGADSAGKPEASHALPALGPGWKKDADLQLRMQVNRAARRSQPAAAMAFFTHDYKTRLPGKAELIDAALEKLHNQFKRVEWEQSSGETRLGEQEALAIDFDATDAQDVDVLGTAYLLGYRGVGYWLLLWAPAVDNNAAAAEIERVRASFALGQGFREGWRERPPETITLAVAAAGVSLACTKAVWEEQELAGYDPKAVRVVKGAFPVDGSTRQRDRHAGRGAIVQVLVVDGAADNSAAERARAYVLANQKDPDRGGYPKTTMAPIKAKDGDEQDRDSDFGALHGRLTKLRMTNTEDRERFVVLGVVSRPNGRLLAVWCECDWELREYWDQEFAALLSSARPLKNGDGKSKRDEDSALRAAE
jgi:hypothetical protein